MSFVVIVATSRVVEDPCSLSHEDQEQKNWRREDGLRDQELKMERGLGKSIWENWSIMLQIFERGRGYKSVEREMNSNFPAWGLGSDARVRVSLESFYLVPL